MGNVSIIFSNFALIRPIRSSAIVIEHLAYEHYYRRLFETYYGSLVNFACRYAHDPEEAEDIVQNIFVAMWNGRVHFENELKMRNYLYRATIHGVYNVERHRRVCESGMAVLSQRQAQDDNLLQDAIQEHELWCRVVEAVDELPERCREICRMTLAGKGPRRLPKSSDFRSKRSRNRKRSQSRNSRIGSGYGSCCCFPDTQARIAKMKPDQGTARTQKIPARRQGTRQTTV